MSGADNQQERLRLEGWAAGFIDGEGCFCVKHQPVFDAEARLASPAEFVVTQGERSIAALGLLQQFFGCGAIYRNSRRDDHREDVFRWCVRRRHDLDERIVPFLEEVPLRTAKAEDLDRFCQVLALMGTEAHLTAEGIGKIAHIVEPMNRRKPSAYLRILRDCTPAASA